MYWRQWWCNLKTKALSCYILFLWEKNYASLLDEANEDVNQPSILTNHSANITEWIDSCGEHANQFHCSQMEKHSRPGGLLSKLLTFLLWVSVQSSKWHWANFVFWEVDFILLHYSFIYITLFTRLVYIQNIECSFLFNKSLKDICIIVNLLAKKISTMLE